MTQPPSAAQSPLRAIEHLNLRAQVTRSIRESIIMGHLPPGSPLVETRLADMLGVSRGTVREALRELQQEKIVESSANGRLQVCTIDSDKVREVFQVRGALESLAADLIAASPGREAKVRRLEERLAVLNERQGAPIVDLLEADVEFHRTLCELSDNATLLSSWRSLEGVIRMAIMHAGPERALSNMTVAKHQPFIDAIERKASDPSNTVFELITDIVPGLVGEQEEK